MRALVLSAALVMALGGVAAAPETAMAQAGNTAGLVDLPGMAPTETSPVRRLPKPARKWIEEERQRQLAKPGDLVALGLEIELAIGPAILKIAERERIDTRDVIMAIMYEVMKGAGDELKSDIRKLETARAKGALAPADDARLAEMIARKTEIDMKVAEVVRSQTVVSRAMVSNM